LSKAVPERVLPAANDAIVLADGTVPQDAGIFIGRRVGHYDTSAALMTRVTPAANGGFFIEIAGGIDHDAGEILCEQSGASGHLGDGTRGSEIMTQIDDPGIAHASLIRSRRSLYL
jgi:hypothetical protein